MQRKYDQDMLKNSLRINKILLFKNKFSVFISTY